MGNDGAMKYIKNGGTMEKPNECPDSIHNLMRNCWRQLPEDRPTFIDICQHLLPHSNQRQVTIACIENESIVNH